MKNLYFRPPKFWKKIIPQKQLLILFNVYTFSNILVYRLSLFIFFFECYIKKYDFFAIFCKKWPFLRIKIKRGIFRKSTQVFIVALDHLYRKNLGGFALKRCTRKPSQGQGYYSFVLYDRFEFDIHPRSSIVLG